ncbi:OprO/OprP family phosphate-selective porin [Planctomycetaceae bacterium SH139]
MSIQREIPLPASPLIALVVCWLTLGIHQSAEGQSRTPIIVNNSKNDTSGVMLPSDWQQTVADLQGQIDALKTTSPEQVYCTTTEPDAKPSFPNVRVTGFFQADALWASQSLENQIAVGDGVASDGDVQDGADFRRARLAAVGQAWDNVAYMLEMDFAFPGRPSFMDVWLELDDAVGSSNLRIGQFRQPLGMDGLTSVKELPFLERALPFAFLPFRQIGAMVYGNSKDELATYAISGFRFPTDTFGGNVGDNGGYGMSTRVTGLLINQPDTDVLIHIGGGYSFIDPANDLVQYRNQPEIFVGETGGGALVPVGVPSNLPPFVDTGLLATENVHLANVELAMARGSFYTQSEVIAAFVNRQGNNAVAFSGAYAHAGYFLTGERRPYNGKTGVFGGVTPKQSVSKSGGIGAWEVAARWSMIDLNDADVQGGRLNNLTGGLNWYLNPNTKFQFNYIHAMLDSRINGESAADLFAMRAQVAF